MLEIRPIVVDENNVVLGGNMRLRAVKELGYKEVPVVLASDLTDEQKKEFIIKDNLPFGDWDWDILANEWDSTTLSDWGMDLPADFIKEPEERDAEPQIDKAEELNKKWKVKTGDLWTIGEHRLMCGDSTKADDVVRVMGGAKADMVFTDPPYGVSYSGLGQSTKNQTIANDNLNLADLEKFLLTAFLVMPCSDGCNIFVCHADQKQGIRPAFEAAFVSAGFVMGGTIIWKKNVASMGWQDFRAAHEPILFGWTKGKNRQRVSDRTLTTVWEVGREGTYLHPTTKPIELVSIALKACSLDKFIVWDSFLGSGTTMVACQNLNRKCRGIEISPNYCAVILERMHTAFPELEIKREG